MKPVAALLAAAVAVPALVAPALAQTAAQPPAHATEGAPAWPVGIPEAGKPVALILNFSDGATLPSLVTVEAAALGVLVLPVEQEGALSGLHHLLVDTALSGEALTQPIPVDETHIHFGLDGRAVTVALPPGQHTLQLVMSDANHVPLDPPVMSKPITVTVR